MSFVFHFLVSTHSRLKAAANARDRMRAAVDVSTHSRLKVAATSL